MLVKEATCSCKIDSCQHLCWQWGSHAWWNLETQRLQWPQDRCDNSSRVLNNVADGKTSCQAMHIRHITWESCKDSPASDWRKNSPGGLSVIWKDKTVTKYDSTQIINSSKYQRGVVGGQTLWLLPSSPERDAGSRPTDSPQRYRDTPDWVK